jgi:hypothetical protein
MSIEAVRAVLVADATVLSLVGQRISPFLAAQGIDRPYVTLQRTALTPQNHLRGNGNLDYVRVQVDSWAETYESVRNVANACRAAWEAAGNSVLGEFDNYDPQVDPGLYRITQDFQVWD